MRILLTGASGFIGRHLARALLADGHEVVAAVRTPLPGADARLSFIHADFATDTDAAAWTPRLAGIDAVINTVGLFREHGTQTFEALHVRAPVALFAACAGLPAPPMVIQLSALGADDGADTAYHRSKKAADDALAALPLSGAIVQPSLVYGADGASTRVFKTLASMPVAVRLGDAPQRVQPIHVDDLTGAILALLRRAPGAGMPRIPLVGPDALPFIDYLAALRAAMGLGQLRVLRLPGWVARALARLGGPLPGGLLDADALRMLDRGNTGDPAPTRDLLGQPARPIAAFVTDPGTDRLRARLDWLLPVLRGSIAAVWIWTAIVSAFIYPIDLSYALLARTGVPSALQAPMLYGACAFDLAFGIATLTLKRRRLLWLAQLALIGFYTVAIAFRLPEFLVHPYGPLSKNLPMLAAIWLLYELEKKER